MAIRMLPYQGHFLIVRKIGYRPDQTNEGHVIEIYPVLYCSHERIEQEVHAQDRRHMPGFNLLSVHITDHGIPFNVDDSIVPRLRKNNFLQKLDDKEIPFPVTILCRTDSIVHQYYRITIFPVPVRDDYISSSRGRTMLTPVYDLSNHNVSAWRQPDEDTEYRVIPGSLRCFLYEVDWNDRAHEQTILSLKSWRELWHDRPTEEYQAFADKTHVLYSNPEALNARGPHPVNLAPENKFRLFSSAWDETTGRLCLSSSAWVRVLDFAKTPKRGVCVSF